VKEIQTRDQTKLVQNSEGNMGIEIKTKQKRSQQATTLKKYFDFFVTNYNSHNYKHLIVILFLNPTFSCKKCTDTNI
jgi:hypothetical protein